MDVSRCALWVHSVDDPGALWASGWMPGPRTPPGARCADTPTRVRAHRRASPVNKTPSVQFAMLRRRRSKRSKTSAMTMTNVSSVWTWGFVRQTAVVRPCGVGLEKFGMREIHPGRHVPQSFCFIESACLPARGNQINNGHTTNLKLCRNGYFRIAQSSPVIMMTPLSGSDRPFSTHYRGAALRE